jgi:hypothetical protein
MADWEYISINIYYPRYNTTTTNNNNNSMVQNYQRVELRVEKQIEMKNKTKNRIFFWLRLQNKRQIKKEQC